MTQPSEVDKAAKYITQFIDAVTPIAREAYEIGLLTLRIDAAQTIFTSAILVVVWILTLRRIAADWQKAKVTSALPEYKNTYRTSASWHLPMDGVPHVMSGVFMSAIGIIAAFNLLSIWTWAKLFYPQLWLAHQAVEKIIN